MKKYIASLLVLVSTTALANPAHWVPVGNANSQMGTVNVYVDDANLISEDGYGGFLTKTILPTKAVDDQGRVIVEMQALFEYNCYTQHGRGKRVAWVTADGTVIPKDDGQWLNVDRPPATETLEAIKARVCFKAQ